MMQVEERPSPACKDAECCDITREIEQDALDRALEVAASWEQYVALLNEHATRAARHNTVCRVARTTDLYHREREILLSLPGTPEQRSTYIQRAPKLSDNLHSTGTCIQRAPTFTQQQ